MKAGNAPLIAAGVLAALALAVYMAARLHAGAIADEAAAAAASTPGLDRAGAIATKVSEKIRSTGAARGALRGAALGLGGAAALGTGIAVAAGGGALAAGSITAGILLGPLGLVVVGLAIAGAIVGKRRAEGKGLVSRVEQSIRAWLGE